MNYGLSTLLTKEWLEEQHIVNGLSIREIARMVGCKHPNVRRYMKKFGIKSHTSLKYNQYGRKYHYNDAYFESIDTEEQAYWLGFIMADGYVCYMETQKRLRIGLAIKDKEHLYKFRDAIQGDMPIVEGEHPHPDNPDIMLQHAYIDICSTKMFDHLENHGIVSRKSGKEIFPHHIPEHLHSHFIRGFFDGDGSWSQTIQDRWNWIQYSQKGGLEILTDIKLILERKGVIFPKKHLFNYGEIWALHCHKNSEVKKIIDYMYNDAIIFLDRKYDLAMAFKD